MPSRGKVIWFTGLSGAGKTTLARALAEALPQPVRVLDADEVRAQLCADLGYTLADRHENIRRIAALARQLADEGNTVLVAAITPLEAMREDVRREIPAVFEVFVDTPLEVCEQRDPKGLYARARAGLLPHFTGIDSPYERPTHPDAICLHTHTVAESVAALLSLLR